MQGDSSHETSHSWSGRVPSNKSQIFASDVTVTAVFNRIYEPHGCRLGSHSTSFLFPVPSFLFPVPSFRANAMLKLRPSSSYLWPRVTRTTLLPPPVLQRPSFRSAPFLFRHWRSLYVVGRGLLSLVGPLVFSRKPLVLLTWTLDWSFILPLPASWPRILLDISFVVTVKLAVQI